MSKILPKSLLLLFVGVFITTANVFAQTTETTPKRVNFGYSQNPKSKLKSNANENKNTQASAETTAKVISEADVENNPANKITDNSPNKNDGAESPSIAKKTLEIVKRASRETVSPTEIYKVGVGDVLFISLQNAPSNSSTYFTVLNDGTIDYPLAGQMISVTGLTVEEIEDLLKEKIKLFENPQVAVKVREHSSHSITVLGLVEKAGEKFLPRDAMPLYFVRAEAVVQSRANQAVIKHADSKSETVDLNDSKNDNILIFPGDIVEFKFWEAKEINTSQPQFFYIGGNIMMVGQKDFYKGLTLTQSILASGGLRRPGARKVIIRRKNAEGLLVATEVNLKAVNDGKAPDPLLEAGDTIEIGN